MDFLLLCIILVLVCFAVYALTHSKVEYCDPADCASCPFPNNGCRHRHELSWDDLTKMNGQHIYVEIGQQLIPVRVHYENDMMWFVSAMGSVTPYSDIKKAEGKFFEKFSKTS